MWLDQWLFSYLPACLPPASWLASSYASKIDNNNNNHHVLLWSLSSNDVSTINPVEAGKEKGEVLSAGAKLFSAENKTSKQSTCVCWELAYSMYEKLTLGTAIYSAHAQELCFWPAIKIHTHYIIPVQSTASRMHNWLLSVNGGLLYI